MARRQPVARASIKWRIVIKITSATIHFLSRQMVAHVVHSVRQQPSCAKEEEAFSGAIKRIWGHGYSQSFLWKKKLLAAHLLFLLSLLQECFLIDKLHHRWQACRNSGVYSRCQLDGHNHQVTKRQCDLHGPPVGRRAPVASRRGRGRTAAAAPSLWATRHLVVRHSRINWGERTLMSPTFLLAGNFADGLPEVGEHVEVGHHGGLQLQAAAAAQNKNNQSMKRRSDLKAALEKIHSHQHSD